MRTQGGVRSISLGRSCRLAVKGALGERGRDVSRDLAMRTGSVSVQVTSLVELAETFRSGRPELQFASPRRRAFTMCGQGAGALERRTRRRDTEDERENRVGPWPL